MNDSLTIERIREAQRLIGDGLLPPAPKMPMKIIESPYLTKRGHWRRAKRTWKERLFGTQLYSNPLDRRNKWKPWKKNKIVVPTVPDDKVYLLYNETIIAHPTIAQRLREQLAASPKE